VLQEQTERTVNWAMRAMVQREPTEIDGVQEQMEYNWCDEQVWYVQETNGIGWRTR